MTDQLKLFTDNPREFLKFLKPKYKLIHLSNVFFRDVHYGVMAYLELNGVKYKYLDSEELARNVIAALERSNTFKKLDDKTWVLNYPEFKLAPSKPAVPAKPAAPAARPAAAAATKPVTAPAIASPATAAAKPATPAAPPTPTSGEAPKN